MGFIAHNAVICTSFQKEKIWKAHVKAAELFGDLVSNLVESKINGYSSFFIAPDGSKEGWSESDKYDELRGEFEQWLRQERDNDDLWIDWVDVKYGGDLEKDYIEESINTDLIGLF